MNLIHKALSHFTIFKQSFISNYIFRQYTLSKSIILKLYSIVHSSLINHIWFRNPSSTSNTPHRCNTLTNLNAVDTGPEPTAANPLQHNVSRTLFATLETSANFCSSTPIKSESASDQTRESMNLNNSTMNKSYNYQQSPLSGSEPSPSHRDRQSQSFNSRRHQPAASLSFNDFLVQPTPKHKNRRSLSVVKDPTQPEEKIIRKLFSETEFPSINESKGNKIINRYNFPTDSYSTPQPSKPKRRVVPLRVTSSHTNRSNFNCSAFQSENNITDLMDRSLRQPSDTDNPRLLLKMNKEEITKDFLNEPMVNRTLFQSISEQLGQQDVDKVVDSAAIYTPRDIIDFNLATNKSTIEKMIAIYSFLIDHNLITNILTELAFILKLMNIENGGGVGRSVMAGDGTADSKPAEIDSKESPVGNIELLPNKIDRSTIDILFKNPHNCVYFAMGVLSKQQHVLAMFDVPTIKILLDNERLAELNRPIKDWLTLIHGHKIQLDMRGIGENERIKCRGRLGAPSAVSDGRVIYQPDDDTRTNFPSDRQFLAFKKQRDAFLAIFRIWEQKHLHPTWIFLTELGPKIRSLLSIMDHPINMAHLAKLFLHQLILSCSLGVEDTSPEVQEVLSNIDITKLSKLRQRLVTSYFSADFQFGGNQLFFKEFVDIAGDLSVNFIEQLKILLINDLIELDGSSYDLLGLTSHLNDPIKYSVEYVIQPETMDTMRVLAKFLGFILAKPYTYDGLRNTSVDNRQIELRNMLGPPFDIKLILIRSMEANKLMVTIPWLVQFLSMLDYVTLRLDYYRQCFDILYELYISLLNVRCKNSTNFVNNRHLRPTSIFILRSCLGWLFDQTNVPESYYRYRHNRKVGSTTFNESVGPLNERKEIKILIPQTLEQSDIFRLSSSYDFILKIVKENVDNNTFNFTVEKIDKSDDISLSKCPPSPSVTAKLLTDRQILSSFHPILEKILNVACPFLVDFRVAIIGTNRHLKTVSRSGRYRHITTKLSTTESVEQSAQQKLADAFLNCQSLSVRRTVEFVIERVFSAVIKDFQMEQLVPLKKSTTERIQSLELTNKNHLLNEMHEVYHDAQKLMEQKWDSLISVMMLDRIQKSFDALLPHETLPAVKDTCISLSYERCYQRAMDWRQTNLSGIKFFTKDVHGDATKLLRSHSTIATVPLRNTFDIDIRKISPISVFDELMVTLNLTSTKHDHLTHDHLHRLIGNLKKCFDEQEIPETMYKMSGLMCVEIILMLVIDRPDLVTDILLNEFISFWKCDKLKPFTKTVPHLEQLNDHNDRSHDDQSIQFSRTQIDYIFANVLNQSVLLPTITGDHNRSFRSLEKFLIALIRHDLLSLDGFNEQFVTLLQSEWPEVILDEFYQMLQTILEAYNENKKIDSYDRLFLETLSDMTRDIMLFD